ncbi:MAG: amino acid ABC transporter substrate-binding protein [Mycolicibacterium sp.]|nr:ABC transporter substrate-binding protein [Mycolicibacterium insubricum]MCB9438748.1 amino acid ABC transporter substrate-binding protein [Mycolicibacterium sp.]MCV7082695.1 amino acid ABC transporter substrate-binding protein [Mycolicibacterium insubricum]
MRFQPLVAAAVAALLLGAAGCGHDGPAGKGPDCVGGALPTLQAGKMVFATDQPADPPWYIDDDPADGRGFESALAFAVAERLGYPADRVAWVRVPFTTAMAPGDKAFDAALSQFSITDQRRQVVDFSSPYYDVVQAVVTVGTSPAATVTTAMGLRPLRLGAYVGTTSAMAARALSTNPITVFNSTAESAVALSNRQVDALVMDLPTARNLTVEMPDVRILGQLPHSPGSVEQLAVMLDKDSPLTGCVSDAIDGLRSDGSLERLQRQWIPPISVPVLN